MKKKNQFTKCISKMVVTNSFFKIRVPAILTIFLFCNCSGGNSGFVENKELLGNENEIKTVESFFKRAEENNINSVKQLLASDRKGFDEESLSLDISQISRLKKKYYLPNGNKWFIEYDTLDDVVKYKNVVVPILISKSDTTVKGKITFSFDYTQVYLPDTIISAFDVELN